MGDFSMEIILELLIITMTLLFFVLPVLSLADSVKRPCPRNIQAYYIVIIDHSADLFKYI
jgi:hypothetical protein